MRFALILITSSLILLAVAALFDVNYIDYKTPIPYSEWRKINFYDFRGLKKPGMTLHGVAEFAYIKTSRGIHFLNSGDIEIITYFHPSRVLRLCTGYTKRRFIDARALSFSYELNIFPGC
jgi:hypothetical protein